MRKYRYLLGAVLLILITSEMARGEWIAYDDGRSYRLSCEVEGDSKLEFFELREVDDGYVEHSALTITDGCKHSVRDLAREFIRDCRKQIGCSNGLGYAVAKVGRVAYDFGDGESELRLALCEIANVRKDSSQMVTKFR